MTDTEQEALDIVELSLQLISPGVSAELLLADPGQSKLERVARSRDRSAPGCPVVAPKACSAIRRGQTMRFGSSEALDACPRLREHAERPCAAICTPLNVMGHSIGVLHLTSVPEALPGERSVDLLEVLASKTGARLGMLRTLASTQLQAQTDPLTGLLNRRSFEAAAAALLKEVEGQAHAVALADLDHFKKLNDTEGHEAGDNALRLFSEVLRDCLRPQDLIGRHGGEEFVVLLKGCKGEHARDALERLRQRLRDHQEHEGGPRFTASFGVAVYPEEGAALASLLRKADRALYEAKRQGRDRVVMHGEVGLPLAHAHEQLVVLVGAEEEEALI
jgi:diguanylate cyclase (GGDEF)-like protein